MNHFIRVIVVGSVVGVCLPSISVRAANTWDGGGGDNNWSTANNWDDNLVPSFPTSITFTGSTRLAPINDLSNLTLNGISFVPTAGAFTVGGNAVTLAGNISNTSGQSQNINLPITLSGDTIVSASSSTTLSQPISGTGNFTASGTAPVQVGGLVTYSGDTILDFAGTATTSTGLSFTVGQPNLHALIFKNTDGGLGPNLSTSGITTATSLSVQNSISGSTLNIGNSLTVNGSVAIGADPLNSSTTSRMDVSGNLVINAGVGNLAIGANSTGSGSTTARLRSFSGNISFTGSELRIGGGQAVDTGNGANGELALGTFTSTSITADTITIGGGSNLTPGTGLLNLGGGVFDPTEIHSDVIYIGTQQSSGTLKFSSSSGTGNTNIRNRAGTGRAAIVVGNQDLNTAANITTSGTLDLSAISSSRTVDILASTLTIGQSSSSQVHAGTVTGTVKFNTRGTYDVTSIQMANNSVDGVTVQGSLTLGTSSISSSAPILTVNSASGPGGGSFTLASNSSASGSANGTFNIFGGTANVNTDILLGATTGSVSGTVKLQAGLNLGTLDMMGHRIGTSSANVTLLAQSGTLKNLAELNGGGTITKTGSGSFNTLILDGTNTYTGATSISDGTLLVNGTHSGGGTYTVSSSAALGGSGSTTSDVSALGLVTPGGTFNGSSIESLDVGSLDLDGGLSIQLNDSDPNIVDRINVARLLDLTTPTSNVSFPVTGTLHLPTYLFATYGSLLGEFGTATVPSGYTIDYHYDNGSDTNNIALVAVPEPGTAILSVLGAASLIGVVARRRPASSANSPADRSRAA